MHVSLTTPYVLVEIAVRNLFASKWKTLIVGGISGCGAMLIVVGMSLSDGVDRAMRRSIIGSIAGHIQVYSSESKENLEVLGSIGFEPPTVTPLDDFAKVRRVLLDVPNVRAVVPMGVSTAIVSSGNTVDLVLGRLRASANALKSARAGSSDDLSAVQAPAELRRQYDAQKAHVRRIVAVLKQEVEHASAISERSRTDDLQVIEHATAETFWSEFDRDALEHLEFLENRVAPLSIDADVLPLLYVGTDPAVFAHAFDRLQILEGEIIPPGQRGFMFAKSVYEEQVKLKTARSLDKLKLALDERRATIAKSRELQRIVRENISGVKELLLQLDAVKTASFRTKLQRFLRSQEADVGTLLRAFLATDDANFHERYSFFYRSLAPELELYRVKVGDTLTIKVVTRGGYVQSAELKVYGTYCFKGLENAPQAGAMNMLDLVSFRELHGFQSAEREQEMAAMHAAAGIKWIDRDRVEAELFGTIQPASEQATTPALSSHALLNLRGTRARQERHRLDRYDPKQLEQGVILHAAVIIDDERKLEQTLRAIERVGQQAKLPLKAVSWQEASGLFGQFAALMRVVLISAVLIIFAVVLLVINNALVMATLDRGREIGTLRAVGAQRRFIFCMLVLESIVIGAASGTLGALVGAGLLLVLGKVGIPAGSDGLAFLFSGPRLFPVVGAHELGFSIVSVLLVTTVSCVYPAWLAMRVSPREAMRTGD